MSISCHFYALSTITDSEQRLQDVCESRNNTIKSIHYEECYAFHYISLCHNVYYIAVPTLALQCTSMLRLKMPLFLFE